MGYYWECHTTSNVTKRSYINIEGKMSQSFFINDLEFEMTNYILTYTYLSVCLSKHSKSPQQPLFPQISAEALIATIKCAAVMVKHKHCTFCLTVCVSPLPPTLFLPTLLSYLPLSLLPLSLSLLTGG